MKMTVERRLIGFYGFFRILSEWLSFFRGGEDFWEALTEEMEAQTWRSPWEMLRSANLAHEVIDCYASNEGWTIHSIYSLFCDESRYLKHLRDEGRIDE
jgi:hypothetical protein